MTSVDDIDMVKPVEVRRQSILSGAVHTCVIPMSQRQIEDWESGNFLIQDVFPNLSPEEREFILTGITPVEWDSVFLPEYEADYGRAETWARNNNIIG